MKYAIIFVLTAALTGAGCGSGDNHNVGGAASNHHEAAANTSAANHHEMPMNAAMPGMSGMSEMKSSPDAAAQPYDLQFLDTMAHHHQGAVEMAQTALDKAENPALKNFARQIIDDQRKEIAQMKEWREKWYPGKPPAVNMAMPGMSDSMKMMDGDAMQKLHAATGREFDTAFYDLMTPHHAGAIVMAREAQMKAEHAEIKTLAAQIIKNQEAEIKRMADWKAGR